MVWGSPRHEPVGARMVPPKGNIGRDEEGLADIEATIVTVELRPSGCKTGEWLKGNGSLPMNRTVFGVPRAAEDAKLRRTS
jgi:hypothetical protein